jgi:hypothetical protein
MWIGLRIWEESEVCIKLVVLLHDYITMMYSQQNIKFKKLVYKLNVADRSLYFYDKFYVLLILHLLVSLHNSMTNCGQYMNHGANNLK